MHDSLRSHPRIPKKGEVMNFALHAAILGILGKAEKALDLAIKYLEIKLDEAEAHDRNRG